MESFNHTSIEFAKKKAMMCTIDNKKKESHYD